MEVDPEKCLVGAVWYRFYDARTELDCGIGLDRFYVISATRCGLWLSRHYPYHEYWKKRILYPSSRRPWALPTVSQAWKSYGARKFYQVEHLESELERARVRKKISERSFHEIAGSPGHDVFFTEEEKNAIAS
jgi:hypothetical protein